jgi:hypothetical protein
MESGITPVPVPLGQPACFFADRNSQKADRAFASSIVSGIIVQGLVLVCAIQHTPVLAGSRNLGRMAID